MYPTPLFVVVPMPTPTPWSANQVRDFHRDARELGTMPEPVKGPTELGKQFSAYAVALCRELGWSDRDAGIRNRKKTKTKIGAAR